LTNFQTVSPLESGENSKSYYQLKIPPHLKCVATLPSEMSMF